MRPFARGLVPVATGDESSAFDRHATDEMGVPAATLMETAGRSAAEVVQRLRPRGEVVAVVGAGNNGGGRVGGAPNPGSLGPPRAGSGCRRPP